MKKAFSIIICFLMLFPLAACTGNVTVAAPTEAPTDKPVVTAEPTEAPTPEPTEAPEPTEEPTPSPEPEPTPTPKPETIEDTVVALINDSVDYQFFYHEQDLTKYTIESVPVYKHHELEDAIKGYAAFRRAHNDLLFYDDRDLDKGGLDALLNNLYLHRAEVIFYSAVGEIYETGYKFCNLDFAFNEIVEEGDFAMAVVSVLNTFQYADLDYEKEGMEDSCEGIHYLISFVRFEDEWRIIAIESDSIFYDMYWQKSFDLEKMIQGVRDTKGQS